MATQSIYSIEDDLAQPCKVLSLSYASITSSKGGATSNKLLQDDREHGKNREFYNQTHILDTSVLSKSPLKCKNLICQHVYIISSITV